MTPTIWGGQGLLSQSEPLYAFQSLTCHCTNSCKFSYSKLTQSVILETHFAEHFGTCKSCEHLFL